MSDIASYRIQLRDGTDFDTVIGLLDHIAGLGVSHLYLSPILTAAPGSTHGYDVTDPTTVDAALGGRDGFERLAHAAHDRGLSIIVDIVPNHMAFGLDTPWLVDVLRNGPDSTHADVFDIDWSAGPLALPWLESGLVEMAEAGSVSIDGTTLKAGALSVPLAAGTDAPSGLLTPDAAAALHDAQHWRLLPWQLERDSITHRRFFSVTSLIGVRIEDDAVFDKTHATLFDLADAGLIDGLRVDHVDGLANPGAYMRRLAERLPDTDIWIEKILVTGERLPDWPVTGTTGYEAANAITRSLTDASGFAGIDTLWRDLGEETGDFHTAVGVAKREVLTDELAAELRQLQKLALALADAADRPLGPEMLREAVTELLVAFPRYRTYLGDSAGEEGRVLWRAAADRAAENVRDRAVIDWIVDAMLDGDSPAARALTIRIEQITGALLAKSHEDTAGFRFNRYLPANEVGGDPDLAVWDATAMQGFLDDRLAHWPRAITLGSTHDTKRSEDARARIIAATHAPGAFAALWEDASTLPASHRLNANRRFYAVQTALAIWGAPDAAQRAADHMVKALREGKQITYWNAPDETREAKMETWIAALLAHWDAAPPDALRTLVAIAHHLSLCELGLRCLIPGMPDIYQGAEGELLQLTDPDNRRVPDWTSLRQLPIGDDLSSDKNRLLRRILSLRRADPALFAQGAATWDEAGGISTLRRHLDGRSVTFRFGTLTPEADGTVWHRADPARGLGIALAVEGIDAA